MPDRMQPPSELENLLWQKYQADPERCGSSAPVSYSLQTSEPCGSSAFDSGANGTSLQQNLMLVSTNTEDQDAADHMPYQSDYADINALSASYPSHGWDHEQFPLSVPTGLDQLQNSWPYMTSLTPYGQNNDFHGQQYPQINAFQNLALWSDTSATPSLAYSTPSADNEDNTQEPCPRKTKRVRSDLIADSPNIDGPCYALLLWRCLKAAPGHRLTLREIYAWIEESTDKARESSGNGWKNSVRHNLSMNAAFIKVPSPKGHNSKKDSMWQLSDSAIHDDGVCSTTRFRKETKRKNQKKGIRAPLRIAAGSKGGRASRKAAAARRAAPVARTRHPSQQLEQFSAYSSPLAQEYLSPYHTAVGSLSSAMLSGLTPDWSMTAPRNPSGHSCDTYRLPYYTADADGPKTDPSSENLDLWALNSQQNANVTLTDDGIDFINYPGLHY